MTDKEELERYEVSEAKNVIRLLKTLSPSPVESAPPSFQAKVLRRLEDKQTRRKRYGWTSWYQIPVSIAAGLALGIALAPLFLSLERKPMQLEIRGKPGVSQAVDKRFPEEWLESIAELLVKGQVSTAYAQLQKFKNRYPDYELDQGN